MSKKRKLDQLESDDPLNLGSIPESNQLRAAKFLDVIAYLAINRVQHEVCQEHRTTKVLSLNRASEFICICCGDTECSEKVLSNDADDFQVDSDFTVPTLRCIHVRCNREPEFPYTHSRQCIRALNDEYRIHGCCLVCVERVKTIYGIMEHYMANFGPFAFSEVVAHLVPDLCRIVVDYGRLGVTRRCLYCLRFD